MQKVTVFSCVFFLIISCNSSKSPDIAEDAKLQLANTYFNNGLYQAAVDEYLDYAENYDLDDNRMANTYYNIGAIYFERLNDYEAALQYFFKIKYLYPQSTLQAEVGKKIVNCLERLKRTTDANRYIQQQAALDKSTIEEQRPGQVVAEIGNRKLTQGDLDFEISQLPEYMRNQFADKKSKQEFLKQLVIQELLYDTAKKQGLDKDKEVIEGVHRITKSLMTEKIIREELQDKVQITQADAKMYYEANKIKYAETDANGKIINQRPFQEVAEQAGRDLAMEKQQEAYQELANRLIKANNVKIFDDKVR
jgi:peptidyl-prolyl cis-trans isomerase C